MVRCTIGVDFGTSSCRAVVVNLEDGSLLGESSFDFPTGNEGVVVDPAQPDLARQSIRDYHAGMIHVLTQSLARAHQAGAGPDSILAIGVDATGSTPIPVDRNNQPLELDSRFAADPAAMAWLWKDHTSHEEARRITDLAAAIRPHYLARCGGAYSSEWFWSKIFRCLKANPEVFQAAYSWVEQSDYLPAWLCGVTDPAKIIRGVCAAGHKAMFAEEWGGLPDEEFLSQLDPALGALRARLYQRVSTGDALAGRLCESIARQTGLPAGLPVAIGAIDAHAGAVGAGIEPGTVVKVIGTSTCDMAAVEIAGEPAPISGLCGIVRGSILPDCWGLEAGQAAVGDLFSAFIRQMTPAQTLEEASRAGLKIHDHLAKKAAALSPGESGLLALDWQNGNRSLLADSRLSGLILGLGLQTQPHEIYRALIEATAFGARMILHRMESHGVPIHRVVNCGGIAEKNDLLMQIYADVMNKPMFLSASSQTPALGAAIFAAACRPDQPGFYPSVRQAQKKMCHLKPHAFHPRPAHVALYNRLFALYSLLHDQFGGLNGTLDLGPVMKELLTLRAEARQRAASPAAAG